jgi:hypothetical protein
MWKKALWVYLGCFAAAVLAAFIYDIVKNNGAEGYSWVSNLILLVMYLPPAMAALELRGRKAPIFLVIVSLLILAVPVAGILKFNEMSLMTIGKVLIFAPMIAALCFFSGRRLFMRKTAAPIP